MEAPPLGRALHRRGVAARRREGGRGGRRRSRVRVPLLRRGWRAGASRAVVGGGVRLTRSASSARACVFVCVWRRTKLRPAGSRAEDPEATPRSVPLLARAERTASKRTDLCVCVENRSVCACVCVCARPPPSRSCTSSTRRRSSTRPRRPRSVLERMLRGVPTARQLRHPSRLGHHPSWVGRSRRTRRRVVAHGSPRE